MGGVARVINPPKPPPADPVVVAPTKPEVSQATAVAKTDMVFFKRINSY